MCSNVYVCNEIAGKQGRRESDAQKLILRNGYRWMKNAKSLKGIRRITLSETESAVLRALTLDQGGKKIKGGNNPEGAEDMKALDKICHETGSGI